MDAAFVREWVDGFRELIERNRDFLTQLDAAIGDADHGLNMDRGMRAAAEKVAGLDEGTAPGPLLVAVGSTLISTVGGASGPLYGTAFRQVGKALGEDGGFSPQGLAEALRAGLEGIQRLGAAAVGDKTIVDALVPALEAFDRAVAAGSDLAAAAVAARDAAEEGARATAPLQARKGRASYLGPRSVGHQDPGATSTALLFAAMAAAAETRSG